MVTAIDIATAAAAQGSLDLKQSRQQGQLEYADTTRVTRLVFDNTAHTRLCSETMQPATAAFSIVEADSNEAQLALMHDTPDASFQHCDDGDECMLTPRSPSDSDLSDEDQHAYPDWQKSLQEDSLFARYRQDTQSQQQVDSTRPAVRWQVTGEAASLCSERHRPQHSVLVPNKPCLKQSSQGQAQQCTEALLEQHVAHPHALSTAVRYIDGRQGRTMLGRKRSRMSVYN